MTFMRINYLTLENLIKIKRLFLVFLKYFSVWYYLKNKISKKQKSLLLSSPRGKPYNIIAGVPTINFQLTLIIKQRHLGLS